ncbi:helix-turn-helix transcriptional regulator [Mycobacterium conspicuum]|uniref:Helix-turn-helix transcriptional regulator n=1 Tax=Mycobacterium conspicuum TaxID=44010 RepID=A0A1X1SSB5_9MYCO|nr:LuxR family transcriptional regulator [Mycobacterium conspicuum]ORV33409.1 LuxR family transcriptional regulator [Mycobacterium conspicuum]BBZ39455.1 helix-turn-helix transcriptional regulator [Mycobacterium conspicuum]
MTPPIRGRDEELRAVREFGSSLAKRRGGSATSLDTRVVIVEGPPGIGKTRLLQEFIARADKGVRSLSGQAFEYQQTVPFAPLFMATLRADPPIGQASTLRRVHSADLRYLVVNDLQAAIGAAAAKTPIQIVLDDIHWADHATLMAVRSLTTGLAGAPVLWVLATRTGAGGPAVGTTVNLLHHDGARVLRLGAVEPTAVADIVADVVRAEADASLLSLADKAHGNPFLVMELILGLQEEGRISVAGGRASVSGRELPQRLTATMQERLDRLSADARRVVQVASVLPDSFSAGLLAEMLERRPIGLLSAVEEAVRADLLTEDEDGLRFRHDLLRQATRQSMPQSLRKAMERDVVAVLLAGGAAPVEVATQLARSAEVGDKAAIRALRQAAQSLAASDPSTAADISKRALQLLPWQHRARGPLVAETVVLLNQAMRYGEAQQLASATLSAGISAQEEADVRLGLSMLSPRPAGQRAEENRRALELASINDLTRTRHLGWLAYNLAMDGQTGDIRRAVDDALDAAALTDDVLTKVLAEASAAIVDCADGYAGRAEQALERLAVLTRSVEPGPVRHLAAINRAIVLLTLGQLDDAATSLAVSLRQARTQRNQMAVQLLTQIHALIHLAAGRLETARASVESLPEPERMTWTRIGGRIGLMVLARAGAHTNDRALLREVAINARDAHSAGGPGHRREAMAALAHLAWQRGDIAEAQRWLTDDFTLMQTPLWAVDLDHIVLAARVAAAAGDAGLRAQVLHAVKVLTREEPGAPLFNAVAQHARAILERDPDALIAAAKSLSELSRPLLHAAAAEDAGTELARANRTPEGLDQLNVAFETYLRCGATADAQRIGQALRAHGISRRVVGKPRPQTGIDSLTDSELKVVHLVAAGSTNREVAQRLYLSPHTVNSHLRSAFAKLGIRSRRELSRLINAHHEPVADEPSPN